MCIYDFSLCAIEATARTLPVWSVGAVARGKNKFGVVVVFLSLLFCVLPIFVLSIACAVDISSSCCGSDYQWLVNNG